MAAADRGYYYGWEVKALIAIETSYGTAETTGTDYVQPAYVRALSWEVNENVERIYGPGSSYRRGPGDEVKGANEVSAHIEFWMADDFATTGVEPFFIKLPLEKYNTAVATTTWVFPESAGNYPGDSAYGSYSLLPFTVEVGYNKNSTTDTRVDVIKGCYVNSSTIRCERGAKVLFTWDILAASVDSATAFVGTGSQASGPPLDWSHVSIKWKGENDSDTSHTGMVMVEATVNNNLERIEDLSLTTGLREASDYIVGKREISGTMQWYKKTTAGQKWREIVYSATIAQTTPDNTIQLGQLTIQINSRTTAEKYLKYIFYDVAVGRIPHDIDFERVQMLTIPWTARYYQGTIDTQNTTGTAGWDNQASA